MAEKTNRPGTPGGPNKPGNKPKFNTYWIIGIVLLALIGMQFLNNTGTMVETDSNSFFEMLRAGDVEKIVIVNKEKVEIYIKPERLSDAKYSEMNEKRSNSMLGQNLPQYYFTIVFPDVFGQQLNDVMNELPPEKTPQYTTVTRKNVLGEMLLWILPFLLILGIWVFMLRRMSGGAGGGPGGANSIFNVGKSRAQIFDKDTNVKVNFSDVAGLEEAKVEIREIVEFLKNPKKYTNLGGKIPKGALLVGPPGTGKTLLAKAVAGEANVPFFSMSGSDFVEMFVGVGASRVRDLFKQAKEKAPCIVFIDEIDAVGRARGRNPNFGSNDERENTLNQLLTEMDGFSSDTGVIILAATNRADMLDKALLRAGRFDRQIHVELPDLNERKEIFKVHVKPLKLGDNVDLDFLAKQTPGFSGADIANVCNESALIAARGDKKAVERQDFLDAVDRIIGGLEKKNKIIKRDEKRAIAFHEAGHATVSWLLEHANPLVKVTIIPRGRALGAAWYLPEERQITTTEQMLDEMCATLGGRASEALIFGKISTGALNDLERVTKQAYAMISYFGMSEKIGNRSYFDSSGQGEYSFSKPYSEKTAELIDDEVKTMIDAQYQRALGILRKNKAKLTKLAEQLLESEVIFSDNLEEIFGKRPWNTEEEQEKQKSVEKAREKHKRIDKTKQQDSSGKTVAPGSEELPGEDNSAKAPGESPGENGDRKKKQVDSKKAKAGNAKSPEKKSGNDS
ncbi:MAG: ATP-dependent zinc metalloprotease FtsH [Bacteroidales bacterium]|nr:ATP-dependent zinc metalloprotease FtsH [Bacteroidales bacterium]MDT8431076.1 ATP-dependent zinc metalloprotease FtsH [Bacteroidales bacterium]